MQESDLVHPETDSEPIQDLEEVKDRMLVSKAVDEVMQVCNHSEQVAYLVWLKLGNRFGAGQRV